ALAAMERAAFAADVCFYYVMKLQLSFLYEDHARALVMARAGEERIGSALGQYFATELPFYASLTLLALSPSTPEDERPLREAEISRHHEALARLAEACPATHRHKYLLVSAERARVRGEEMEAMRLYDRAIDEAGRAGFVHHEALASELCAKF